MSAENVAPRTDTAEYNFIMNAEPFQADHDRDTIFPEHLRTSTVCGIFAGMIASGDWGPMPLLVDALRDAGAGDDDLCAVLLRCVPVPEPNDGEITIDDGI